MVQVEASDSPSELGQDRPGPDRPSRMKARWDAAACVRGLTFSKIQRDPYEDRDSRVSFETRRETCARVAPRSKG
jgi:hypothetical protein